MALIIYPDQGADSFVTVSEADAYIALLTLDSVEWDALPTETREVYLRIAYRDIIDHTDSTTYPDPIPECVGESQSLMAVHDLVNNLSSGVEAAVTGAIKKNKVGSIEQEFYDTTVTSKTTSRVPEGAETCLYELGYYISDINGLTQLTLGHS